jgi:protein-L-isoaspartate(D-aspartate) O-methyltransferase
VTVRRGATAFCVWGTILVALVAPVGCQAGAGGGDEAGAVAGREDERMQDPYREQRIEMVSRQIAARGIRDERVLAAMRDVPRHEFVPAARRDAAYGDHPVPIGHGQTISQPYIVALMTEALRLRGGEKVLELGTGSGYQAAVLAALADTVFTIEYFAPLAAEAGRTFARLGYERIVARAGDGWQGWPEHAPFDAAMVTFAAPRVPAAVTEQLRSGGRLCIPLGPAHGVQRLMVYTKQEDGSLHEEFLCAVRFVPVQGEGAD